MPKQDATLWKPDTCDCEFYVRVENGKTIFLDHEAVRAEHQRRIDVGDPTASKQLAPIAKLCNLHTAHGHRLHQNLISVIEEEQTRKSDTLSYMAEIIGIDLTPNKDKIKALAIGDKKDSGLTIMERVKIYTALEFMQKDVQDFIAEYRWEFDADRNLKVSHPRLKEEHKKQLQDKCDMAHGQGKVKVEETAIVVMES